MSLTEWVCKSCGGTVTVDDSNKHGKCNYCGKEYTEQEIIQYNQYHYHIQKAQINMANDESVEAKLKSAEVYLTQIKDYDEARKLFTDVSKIQPDNYLCWWGLARVETKEFEDVELGLKKFAAVAGYVENAFIFVPADKEAEIKSIWSRYASRYNEAADERRARMNELNDRINKEERQWRILNSRRNKLSDKERFFHRFTWWYGFRGAFCILMILLVIGLIVTLVNLGNVLFGGKSSALIDVLGGIIIMIFSGCIILSAHIAGKKTGLQAEDAERALNECSERIKQLQNEFDRLNTFFDCD